MPQESLKNKTIKGTAWSAADALLGQGVTFVVGIILARLLTPDEYGLVGICLIFNTILNGIVDSGFSNALIRKKSCTNDDYNTMFITNMAISIVLYIILFFCASWISSFFEREELIPLLQVSGSILVINALGLTHTTILTKNIDFKTKTKASIFSAVLSGVIGIVMACMGYGVWALVGQMVGRQFLYTVSLWFFIRWWPVFKFDTVSFRYMWGFGWKLLLSGLLNNIWNQLYQVVVGKFYSPATLGQYTRSRQFSGIFSENLTSVIQRVSFPVLSEIQDDKIRMVSAYRRIIKLTMFVTAIGMITLAAIAEPLVFCLIGDQWQQAASFLPLICISMSLYPLHAINLNMLQVQGRSDIFLILEIVKKIIAVGPICLGIFVGIYWMLVGSVFAGIIGFFLNSYYTGKKLGYSSFQQLKDIMPSYLLAFIIACTVYFFKYLNMSHFMILVIQLFVGTISFFAICESIKCEEYIEIKNIVKSYLIRYKHINFR